MISQISICNFLLIQNADIVLDPKLTVFTGESGSGKSLVFKAIRFCLGGRLDKSYIGRWQSTCQVTMTVTVSSYLKPLMTELGIESETLIIDHTLSQQKRTCTINGQKTSLQIIKKIAKILVIDSDQGMAHKIWESDFQQAYIDELIDQKTRDHYQDCLQHYQSLQTTKQRMETLLAQEDREWLENQQETLSQYPYLESYDALQLQQRQYQSIASIKKGFEAEQTNLAMIRKTLYRLQKIEMVAIDTEVVEIEASLESIEARFKEALSLDDEKRYQAMEAADKIAQMNDLARKYKVSPQDLYQLYQESCEKLEALADAERNLDTVRYQLQQAKSVLLDASSVLMSRREATSIKLSKHITQQLVLLGMSQAIFKVQFSDQVDVYGFRSFSFQIQSNPGQGFKPIGQCLSGGEMSRLSMLLMLYQHHDNILILDEVDVGVSGKTGVQIKQLMQSLAQTRQLLCISHLAQVASGADRHFLIVKQHKGTETESMIQHIEGEHRALEISRLMCGEGNLAEQAKDLLETS